MTTNTFRLDYHKRGPFGMIFFVCIFLCLFLAMPVEALRVKTNWARRVDLSEKIVRGEVIDVRSYWDSKKGLIYTDVTILVDEHIKGYGTKEMTINLPGGTVGDQTHFVSDTPQFEMGDYGIIFLEPSGHVTGGPDGVYFLQKPITEGSPFQSASEDSFLSWIKAYGAGQIKISYEETFNEESSLSPAQEDTSNATISGVSPSAISAGTGGVVTISGSGFGDSRGSKNLPTIAFRYKDSNYMYDNLAIKSWSDTQIQVEVWTGVVNNYYHSPGSWDNPNGTVAFINSSGGFESFWALAVPFGYGNAKWLSSSVSYYVNETGGPSGSLNALQAAANTWSGAGANLSFQYAGATTRGLKNDGYNTIGFANLGSSSIIAQATTYFSDDVLIEADIQFNTEFPFSTDLTPSYSEMDLQSIAVHELGHWLRLLDLYGANDSGKVMYGYGSFGQVKRTLASGDQSGIKWIYPVGDFTSPTPNPMTWVTPPYQTGTNSISMVATIATDLTAPVQYYFNFTGSPTGGTGGIDSGWRSSTSYVNSWLQANHQYGYRVKARDGILNETDYSTPNLYAYTAIESPAGISFGTLTSTSIQAQSINTPSGLNYANSGLLIENTVKGTNSGWKQDNNFWTSGSLSPNTSYSFQAKARNGDSIETGYSPTFSKYTLANSPNAASFSNVTQSCIRCNWTANNNPGWTEYFCENTTTGTNSGWTTNIYWDSCGLVCGSSHSFRVKARNGNGIETVWTSLGSRSTLVCPPPDPPTNVQASDGTYLDKVQVTWTASSGANSYTIYRATSKRGTKTALGTTSDTTYDDTTALVGKIYYYYIKATNAYGTSAFSVYNTGYLSDGRPSVPTNVQASDGTYLDKVQVTWTTSSWATSYTIYRATSKWGIKTALGTTSDTTYDDKTALVGKIYYYYIKATNAYGTSAFSVFNTGYR